MSRRKESAPPIVPMPGFLEDYEKQRSEERRNVRVFVVVVVVVIALLYFGAAALGVRASIDKTRLDTEQVQLEDGRIVECVIPKRGTSGTPDCDWEGAR